MRQTRNLDDEVIVKLTQLGERTYTMNSLSRDTLNKHSVYGFTIRELISIFGSEINNQVFVDDKLVFPSVKEIELMKLETQLEQELGLN